MIINGIPKKIIMVFFKNYLLMGLLGLFFPLPVDSKIYITVIEARGFIFLKEESDKVCTRGWRVYTKGVENEGYTVEVGRYL